MTDVGVQNLAAAIVREALMDVEAAYAHLLCLQGQEGREDEIARATYDLAQLEKWFRSPWYEMLTDLDPDLLLKGVKDRVRRNRK